ncbi:NADH-quinone oxidoreductase subunit C [Streptomyces sp. NPDC020965]|uniref:NADH-quinone oxidoreductase subunit C n=1 Tax=Streptomyces sp. NPDC020965 TaxID=3365105 RepID=UPI0037B209AA
MSAYDRLPDAVTEIFGAAATAEHAYDLLTVDVPADSWITALETARTELSCTYFDWLSAVDEPGTGFRICAHVVSLADGGVRRLLVRTTVPHEAPVLPSAITVYKGAGWHERETHEMFGVTFTGHPHLVPLLLPENFEGHPLRKDFVLAARVAKAWPGAKEPGESEHGGPKRRQMLPPGVPDPNDWGPLKGQLPPAPARPARTPRAAGAAGERPPRRARTAGEGSASQSPAAQTSAAQAPTAQTPTAQPPAVPPRRTRSAAEGSASQSPATAPAPEAAPTPEAPAVPTSADAPPAPPTSASDAPWHQARPAFGEKDAGDGGSQGTDKGTGRTGPANSDSVPGTGSGNEPGTDTRPVVDRSAQPAPPATPPAAPAAEPEPTVPDAAAVPVPPSPAAGPEPTPSAPEVEPEPKPTSEPEPKPEPKPRPEAEPTPEPQPEAKPQPDPDADPDADADASARPRRDAAAQSPPPGSPPPGAGPTAPPTTRPPSGSTDGPQDDRPTDNAGGDPA